ncbi:right-handed parallel beta-helix repeat-containing protein [Pseudomonas canadensis]|uniref:right-handed parallel beta-helix repeat-containing protein n=1 Tax=Pseudomonas canadensis TaxID=915099 RepID=UPI0030CC2864
MAVPAGPTEKRYIGNGVTKIFTIPFLLLAPSDLDVFIDGVEVVSGFTITGAGNPTSSITFTVAPANLSSILLNLNVPFERLNDYQENGDFLSSTVNRDFDRIWQALKQLYRFSTRSLTLGFFDVDGAGAYRAKGNKISDLGDPVNLQDAVTKKWVTLLLDSVSGAVNTTTGILYDAGTLFDHLRFGVARTVDSIAALRLLSGARNQRAFVLGYYVKGDGGGGAYFVDPTDTTTADNGGTVIVAADGARWKLAKTQNVSVRQFGAKGDGVSDDTVSLQNAIDSGIALTLPSGAFPYTHLVSEKSLDIMGGGLTSSFLVCKSTTGYGIEIVGRTDSLHRVSLSGFSITNFSNSTTGAALRLDNVSQGFISDLVIVGGPGQRPIDGLSLFNVSQFSLVNVQVNDMANDGIKIDGHCVDIYIANSRSDSNGGNGIRIRNSEGIYCVNVSAFLNTISGWFIEYGGTNDNLNMFFVNCIGDSSQSANWNISDLTRGFFSNCWGCTQKNAVNNFVSGFMANKHPSGKLSRLEFVNCVANNNNRHGFSVGGAQFVTLTNCLSEANGMASTGNGVEVSTSTEVNISDSRLLSNTGTGLTIGASCTGCSIVDSFVKFNAVAPVASSSPDLVIRNVAGYKTSGVGAAAISSGTTSVVVSHGLAITPLPGKITTTQTASTINNVGSIFITAIGASTFTANVRSDPGSALQFNWGVVD